ARFDHVRRAGVRPGRWIGWCPLWRGVGGVLQEGSLPRAERDRRSGGWDGWPRKNDGEGDTLPHFALDANGSSVRLNQAEGNIETEPKAIALPLLNLTPAREATKKLGQHIR